MAFILFLTAIITLESYAATFNDRKPHPSCMGLDSVLPLCSAGFAV